MKKFGINTSLYFSVLLFTFLMVSCNRQQENAYLEDEPTYGTIHISVDESLKPLIDTQITTFQGIYNHAKIIASYKSESEAITDMLNDSSRLAIVTRELSAQEQKALLDQKIVPRKTKIAFDAIAVIVNSHSSDTLIKLGRIIDLLSGKITKWNQLLLKSKNSSTVQVVFDNNNSGIVSSLSRMLPEKKIINKNCYAMKNSPEVISYVSKHKDAVGFIGLSWISDSDSVTNRFLSTITVGEIAPLDTAEGAGFHYKPYQANIALKTYPLMRSVYILSREARAGLGTGFAAFVAGDKGQRIVLKSGLIPATMPIRLVTLKNQNLQ